MSCRCGHCHTLAPAWRGAARALAGAVRVGAVNCQEEWNLCRQQGINAYPTLIYSPAAGPAIRYKVRKLSN